MAKYNDVAEAHLVRSQALIHIINAKITVAPWPRAGGKTSGGIGPRILQLSEKMPRGQVGLVTDTFERMHKSLVPSIEGYLTGQLGMVEGIDFVKYRKPPADWPKPIFPPAAYDHVITFATGFTLCEISLQVQGSANGYNLQAVIGDEIKYWDYAKFKSEVKPAIRGGRKEFGHLPEFQSQWLFTDKYPSKGASIDWVLALKERMDPALVHTVYTLAMEVIRLEAEQEALEEGTAAWYAAGREIRRILEVLDPLRKKTFYYCEALPYENRENLGEEYYQDQREELSDYEYRVAIENQDPDKAIVPFYPSLNAGRHYYHAPAGSYNPHRSLIITLDYQFKITPVVTAQFDQLDGSPYTTLNFVKSLHTLDPETIEAALKRWCDYFAGHVEKTVYYIFNQTAIGRSPHGKTFRDIVFDYLVNNDWNVIEVYTGDTPDHDIKYEALKKWLQLESADGAIRINQVENPYMVKAMERTGAILVPRGKDGRTVTKKDKASERSSKVPPELSTHYPDAWDDLVWGALEMGMVPMQENTDGMDFRIG